MESSPVIVLLNPGSGQHSTKDLANLIVSGLESRGRRCEVWTSGAGESLDQLARRAVQSRPYALVAAGGDGTVSAVAQALMRSSIPFGIIPMGTFNYFAKLHRIPDALDPALDLIAAGAVVEVGVGRLVGDSGSRLFLNNVSFGVYTSIIQARERHKAVWGRRRIVAVLSAAWTLLRPHARRRVSLSGPGGAWAGRASLVFVGVNPAQFEDFRLPIAAPVAQGALGIAVLRSLTWRAFLDLAFRSLFSRVDQAETLDCLSLSEVEIRFENRGLVAAVDGEIQHLKSPLRLVYEPGALRLLAAGPATE